MKKISIITVNYNDYNGLEKTFESLKNQTWKDFEYIVIDGNSNDGSKELIEKNSSNIDYWVSEKDTGIYNAMNKGIKKATGDYLYFLNAGDILYSNSVLNEVQNTINSKVDLYYGNAIFLEQDKEVKTIYPDKLSFHFFTYNCICHQSCFIKRTLFNDIFLYNENFKIVSDWEFLIYALSVKNISYHHINNYITYYDFSGISSKPESEGIRKEERAIVMEKYFPMYIDDYKNLEIILSKRIQYVLHIKKFPFAWKILKGLINLLIVFLPKLKK